jgi:hypothetical protein
MYFYTMRTTVRSVFLSIRMYFVLLYFFSSKAIFDSRSDETGAIYIDETRNGEYVIRQDEPMGSSDSKGSV